MKKENYLSCFFGLDIISNGLIWYIYIVLAKKTTELVLLFHKKTTKLVFLLPNMGQLCFKVIISLKKHFSMKLCKMFITIIKLLYITAYSIIDIWLYTQSTITIYLNLVS